MTLNFFNIKAMFIGMILAMVIFGLFAVNTIPTPSIHGQMKHPEYGEINDIFTSGECMPGHRAELYSQKLNEWMTLCQVGDKIPVRFSGRGTWGEKIKSQFFAKIDGTLQDAINYVNRKIIEDGYVLKNGTPPTGIITGE
jgi:hypothetical protein